MYKKITDKEYYTLKDLESIVDLKTRQLKYRMVAVKKKYQNNKKLLWKGTKSWNIHWSIIFEFDRVKLSNKEREMKSNTLVTINPDGNYDIAYNLELLNNLMKELSMVAPIPVKCLYFIEQGELGDKYHIHFVTNLTTDYSNLIRRHANCYTDTNTDVRCIHEEWQLLEYLHKDVRAQGELILD